MRKIIYSKGQNINGLIFITDVPTNTRHRKALFECHCGNRFESKIPNVKNGNTKSCGCDKYKTGIDHWNYKHGEADKYYLYSIWEGIKSRCYKDRNPAWNNYGGRGIKMDIVFRFDFVAFKSYILETIGERPEGYSLDRIDNNKGYIQGNLRWATDTEQVNNRRPFKLTTEDVAEIRWLLSMGYYHKDIGKDYNVHAGTISKINRNIRHVI